MNADINSGNETEGGTPEQRQVAKSTTFHSNATHHELCLLPAPSNEYGNKPAATSARCLSGAQFTGPNTRKSVAFILPPSSSFSHRVLLVQFFSVADAAASVTACFSCLLPCVSAVQSLTFEFRQINIDCLTSRRRYLYHRHNTYNWTFDRNVPRTLLFTIGYDTIR